MSKINDYLDHLPPSQKNQLERIRNIVIEFAPEAKESFSYGMPAFKYKNKPLLYYGAFKNHMSVFPTSGPTKQLGSKLSNFLTSKGTLQFTENNPIPESLLKEVLKVRINAINKSAD